MEVSFNEHPVGVVPTSETTSEIQLTLTASGFQLFFYKLLRTELILDSKKGVFNDGLATLPLELSFQKNTRPAFWINYHQFYFSKYCQF